MDEPSKNSHHTSLFCGPAAASAAQEPPLIRYLGGSASPAPTPSACCTGFTPAHTTRATRHDCKQAARCPPTAPAKCDCHCMQACMPVTCVLTGGWCGLHCESAHKQVRAMQASESVSKAHRGLQPTQAADGGSIAGACRTQQQHAHTQTLMTDVAASACAAHDTNSQLD